MLDLSNPVIAAVRNEEEFLRAVESGAGAIFLIRADIISLPRLIAMKKNKRVYVHIDMAEGVGKDRKGLEYLLSIGADGIISTKNHLITAAKELGLGTVERFFIIDSMSVATALESVRSAKPDYAELMPGVIPKAVKSFVERAKLPIIAGGLIETKQDIISALSAGADGVSTGKAELWNL